MDFIKNLERRKEDLALEIYQKSHNSFRDLILLNIQFRLIKLIYLLLQPIQNMKLLK